jgi:hypothetical protein
MACQVRKEGKMSDNKMTAILAFYFVTFMDDGPFCFFGILLLGIVQWNGSRIENRRKTERCTAVVCPMGYSSEF